MNSYIFGKLCFIPALSLGRKDAHLWELVLHPCTFFGMDWRSGAEGSSCLGAGKGKKWARLCRTLHGQGHCSPFEKIFWNPQGSAFCHARPRRPAREVPQERLQFHVGKTRLAEFPLRFLPERPGTSKPIFSLPFKLRIRHKAQVPGEPIYFTDEEMGARFFRTLISSLSEYQLIPNCTTLWPQVFFVTGMGSIAQKWHGSKYRAHLKACYARDQRNTIDCHFQEDEQPEEHRWAQRHGTLKGIIPGRCGTRRKKKRVSRSSITRKVRKEWAWACLQRGLSFQSFWFHCPSVLKAGWPDLDKSNLLSNRLQFWKIDKQKSRTRRWGPLARLVVGCHTFQFFVFSLRCDCSTLAVWPGAVLKDLWLTRLLQLNSFYCCIRYN